MELTPEVRQALRDELVCIADSKWVLGHWYIMVMRNGRGLQDFTSMAAMAQDVLGHTRALFKFLEDVLDEPEGRLEFGRGKDALHAISLLDHAPESWGDFAGTVFMAEAAIAELAATLQDGAFEIAGPLLEQIATETGFHLLCATGWLKSFSDQDRAGLKAALPSRLPQAVAWFGAQDADTKDVLLGSGIRARPVGEARRAFVEGALPKLAEDAGLDAAAVMPGAAPGPSWDAPRRRERDRVFSAEMWEFMVPTNEDAVLARRPLAVSVGDNVGPVAVKAGQ
ncbi:MAG TPA: Phenylacetic acid catabolic protein [Alphaproteobacteria bacterium]|nr:Phenylacetic acid catabolic protein [Alphaproteobacteria bacterium]